MKNKTETPKPTCPQCGKPIETPVSVGIVQQVRVNGKKTVATNYLQFCSAECGSHYQMGCEG